MLIALVMDMFKEAFVSTSLAPLKRTCIASLAKLHKYQEQYEDYVQKLSESKAAMPSRLHISHASAVAMKVCE